MYRDTLMIAHKSLNELTLQNELQNFVTNHNNNKTHKLNIKILAKAWNQTPELLHQRRIRYPWTTQSTESIGFCQAN